MAFNRAIVSSLGGVGKVASSSTFSAARLFSKEWVDVVVLLVAVANVKVFFFMRQNLQVVNKHLLIQLSLDTYAT